MIFFGEYFALMYLYIYEAKILNMEIDRYILEKFFMNEADASEISAIEAWLNEDEANKNEFQKAYDRFVLTTLTVSKMELKAEMTRMQTASKARRIRRIAVYAASVAAALILGVLLNWHFNDGLSLSGSPQMLALSTDPGQRANVTLPDGTVVKLNSGSVLEYPTVFSRKERRVKINGEAMFDVAKDADKPFIVETFAYDVKVLGTKFNIIAEEQTGDFSTALLEGRVSILDKTETAVAELRPDQIATLVDGRLHKVQSENLASQYRWTEGIVNCGGLTFTEALKKFEKTFGVDIRIEKTNIPDKKIRYMKVYVSDGPAAALELLQNVVDFDYSYDQKTNTYLVR